MSFLTRLSLRNRSVVALAVIAVIVLGIFAITSLKQELLPNMQFPFLTVITMEQGASPEEVERGITDPIEASMNSAASLKELSSYSNEGMSIILAQYEFGTNMKDTQSEVQAAVTRLQATFPQAAMQPVVSTLNFNDFPVVQLAVTSTLPADEQTALVQSKVVPRLQQIPGVADVSVSGNQEERLQIRVRPADLVRYQVAPAAIMTAVQMANSSTSAGTITSGTITYPVTVSSAAQTVTAFKNLAIAPASDTGSGAAIPSVATVAHGPVTLGDVADVSLAPTPLTALTRTDGKPSIGIAVTKARDGNTVQVSNAVKRLLPELRKDLQGATVTVVQDQATFIQESISSMWQEGLIGAVFAVFVIFLFLRNWRSTLVAGLSIPLSVVGALIILWARAGSLNSITLGGLTIAIGRVIDDSIVVLENTYRHLQEGDDVHTAAYTATREVARAITASTLTTVAVFLPLGFVKSFSAEYFRPFGLTVTFALVTSLLVALTVVPVVITAVLSKRQVGHREPQDITGLQKGYLPILGWAVRHKVITLVGAVAVFVGVMALGPMLKTNLFDSSQDPSLSIRQEMEAGTSLQATADAAVPVERVLQHTAGIKDYQVTIGSTGDLFGPGGGTNASASQAQYTVSTDPKADKNGIVRALRGSLAKLTGAGTLAVSGDSGQFGDNTTIEVRVSADDPPVLREASTMVLDAVKRVPDLVNVQSNLSDERPQVQIDVNQKKAVAAGVDPSSISQLTTLAVSGLPVGTVPTAKGPLPVEITVPEVPGLGMMLLPKLPLPAGNGTVPLGKVATILQVQAPAQITHVNAARTATISATVVSNNVGAASSAVQKALTAVKTPAGSSWEMAGAGQETKDTMRTLGIAMAIAVLLVYIIMVATFQSLLNPLILLVSIPFAAVGAVALMFVTGTSLGMPSLIGLLMLIGIVVTNAIVLLDLVEKFRRAGMAPEKAVIEGGRRRLRPILMTAAATILALLPMALGFGSSAFLSAPLALVVIGGLFTSTLLSLILVPVLYLLFQKLHFWRRRETPADQPSPTQA